MIGGAVGAACRYQLGRLTTHSFGPGFPWGTLAANLGGGLMMGLLVGVLARGVEHQEPLRLLLGVGLLGGFTTFSAFSLETFAMVQRGEIGLGVGYALASVIGSVIALFAGLLVVRSVA